MSRPYGPSLTIMPGVASWGHYVTMMHSCFQSSLWSSRTTRPCRPEGDKAGSHAVSLLVVRCCLFQSRAFFLIAECGELIKKLTARQANFACAHAHVDCNLGSLNLAVAG